MSSSSSSSLPEEIIRNILSRLPVKSLLRFRSVCKPWCNLLTTDSHFAKMHLNHAVQNKQISVMLSDFTGNTEERYLYSIDCDSLSSSYDEPVEAITYPFQSPSLFIKILGTCNGLVCIEIDIDVIYIWNPSTQEYKQVPPPPPIQYPPPTPSESNLGHYISYGFGYDCKIDDYKLILIRSFQLHDGSDYCVYTLGSKSWKGSQYIHYNFGIGMVPGLLANRALHWVENKTSLFTFSFDISDERFQKVPLPKGLGDISERNLGVLGDSLCVLCNCNHHLRYDLWVMKDYGVIESWTKLFTIARENGIYSSRPIQVLQNGEILFQSSTSDDINGDDVLVSYDPKHEIETTLMVHGLPRWFIAETYVGTLVSLNSGTFIGRERNEETVDRRGKKKLRKKKNKKKTTS